MAGIGSKSLYGIIHRWLLQLLRNPCASCVQLLIVALIFSPLGYAQKGYAQSSQQCPSELILIQAAQQTDITPICAAGTASIRYLKQLGLAPQRLIRIQLADTPLNGWGETSFGIYDKRADLIRLRSLDSILAANPDATLYGQPMDAEHFAGLIAHEIAHAVVQHNAASDRVSNAAQEYLAHATQMAVLPAPRRAQIIAATGVGPWQKGDVISDVYMGFSPTKFAVKCYLHLNAQQAPVAFVRSLIDYKWRHITLDS